MAALIIDRDEEAKCSFRVAREISDVKRIRAEIF